MKLTFEVTAKLEVVLVNGQPNLSSVGYTLHIPKGLDLKAYIGPNGYTPAGHKTITNVLIQNLIGSIHTAHQSKAWDSAEHLRYIIAELERGFVENPDSITINKITNG